MAENLKKTDNQIANTTTQSKPTMAAVSATVGVPPGVLLTDDKAVIENLDLLMNFESLLLVDNWDELLYLADAPDKAELEIEDTTEEGK